MHKKQNDTTFLGGTWNNSTWRERLIKNLKIPYFNPIVDNYNEEAQKKEDEQRKTAKFVLFVITPLMKGTFSIAEAVDCSNKRPKTTLFCILEEDDNKKFDKTELKSLKQVSKMIKDNGGNVFDNLKDVANFLNNQEENSKMQKLAGV